MGQGITIVINVETAEAAAKIQQFADQVGSKLSQAAVSSTQAAVQATTQLGNALSGGLSKYRMGLAELEHTARSTADYF